MSNGLLDEKGNIISEDGGVISKRLLLASRLKELMDAKGIALNERPNFETWIREPYLTIEWWQMLTGYDKNSAAPVLGKAEIENGAISKGMVNLASVELYFETDNEVPFLLIRCPAVKGVDKDFYGRKLETGSILPGPFQVYRKGHNRFVLRPAVIE